jgi:hypothetical protein
MRRISILTAAFLALAAAIATAGPIRLGAGVYGGVSVPVLNDLSKEGAQYGFRIPVELSNLFTVEPYYTTANLGDVTQTVSGIDYTRDGGDLKNFGVNALVTFGTSFSFYPWGGLGSYKISRSGADDISKMGYQFGLGFGLGFNPSLKLHIRGGLDVVPTNETSQKFAEANAGLSYAFKPF